MVLLGISRDRINNIALVVITGNHALVAVAYSVHCRTYVGNCDEPYRERVPLALILKTVILLDDTSTFTIIVDPYSDTVYAFISCEHESNSLWHRRSVGSLGYTSTYLDVWCYLCHLCNVVPDQYDLCAVTSVSVPGAHYAFVDSSLQVSLLQTGRHIAATMKEDVSLTGT